MTLAYVVYDYTTNGHMDLWSIYVFYVQYIYNYSETSAISIVTPGNYPKENILNIYFYLFVSNWHKNVTHSQP